MMKKCTKCEVEFLLDEFPIMNKKSGKRFSMCVKCKREYDRVYYQKNREINKENKNKLQRENRIIKLKYVNNLLQNSSCLDCGNSDWRVLEFDHRERDKKEFSIADCSSYSIEKIQLEIDKCDIVCANCHNIRTIEQRGYYRYLIK